ncbi:unnamed protein product [Calypogeia fissa]
MGGHEGIARLWRRKLVGQKATGTQLARHLGVAQLVPIGVGSTIGAGVYVLVGTVAREKVGPALPFAFLIAGFAAALSALCYAELASRCPSAGSAYHYAYTCVGEGPAWIIGWALVLEYTVGGATVARGIAPNLAIFFGGAENLPALLRRQDWGGVIVDPGAGLLVIAVTILLCIGIRESAGVQAFMTVLNVIVLVFVVVAGSYAGFKTGWQGYKQADGYLPFGVNGVLGGAATLFFAYIGFDTVASTAEEVKNPQRDLPLGIALALGICSVLYMLVSSVIVGIVPYSQMDPDTPMSTAFAINGMPWAMYIVTAGAVAALSTTLMGSLLPQPRILMAMARDGLLPRFFARISKATHVPVNGTVMTGMVATLMSFAMNVDQLAGMVSVGTLLAFSIVAVSILILRFAPPTEPPIVIEPSPQAVARAAARAQTPPENAPPPTFFGMLSRKHYFSPVLSLLSESSMSSMPGFLQAVEEHRPSKTQHSSDTSSSGSDDEAGEPDSPKAEKESFKESKGSIYDPLIAHPPPVEEMSREDARRWAAAFGIGGVCCGALLVSIGASLPLPLWLRWTILILGVPVFLGGTVVLTLIDQDEGRHKFGDAGGFVCPWVPGLPVFSVLINVYLLVNLGLPTWLRVGVWLVIGVIIYAAFGINNSVLSKDTQRESASSHSGSARSHQTYPTPPIPISHHV